MDRLRNSTTLAPDYTDPFGFFGRGTADYERGFGYWPQFSGWGEHRTIHRCGACEKREEGQSRFFCPTTNRVVSSRREACLYGRRAS